MLASQAPRPPGHRQSNYFSSYVYRHLARLRPATPLTIVHGESMATAAQLLANQTNARQSTGPQTDAGKRRSAQNARKHGLFISDACLRLECPQEWADTLADYLAEHCPATATERQLVYQLTLATLRQRRIERIETSLVNQHSPQANNLTREQASDALASAHTQLDRQWAALNRARAQAERSFYRALKELRNEAKAHPYRSRTIAEAIQIETPTHHSPPARKEPSVQNEPKPAPIKSQNEANPPSRNQPCPCRSGLKYKRCCGQ